MLRINLFLSLYVFVMEIFLRHKVIRVVPETKDQLDSLRQWQSSGFVDFWSPPAAIKNFADIRVTPIS